MKTLDQVEARTPIAALPYTISASGSYYLTGNVSVSAGDGITIAADNVTLDLNGFNITTTASTSTGTAILFSGARTNIAIANGTISSGITESGGAYSGNGFLSGVARVNRATTALTNVRVSRLTVSGVASAGITLPFDSATTVDFCNIRTAGGIGIVADTITNCSVADSADGVSCKAIENSSVSSFSDSVIGNSIKNCNANSINGTAIQGGSALDCYGNAANGGYGVSVSAATNCYGYSSSSAGVSATSVSGCSGLSFTGAGIMGQTVNGSYGSSTSGPGISASLANGSSGTSVNGIGLNASLLAEACVGKTTSGTYGLYTQTAQNCYGENAGGSGTYGLYASAAATNCYGFGTGSNGNGLYAYIAMLCHGIANNGNTVSLSSSHAYFCGSGPATYP